MVAVGWPGLMQVSEEACCLCCQVPSLSLGRFLDQAVVPAVSVVCPLRRYHSTLTGAGASGFHASYLVWITVLPSLGNHSAGRADLAAVIIGILQVSSNLR